MVRLAGQPRKVPVHVPARRNAASEILRREAEIIENLDVHDGHTAGVEDCIICWDYTHGWTLW